jgi:hypothetical protein
MPPLLTAAVVIALECVGQPSSISADNNLFPALPPQKVYVFIDNKAGTWCTGECRTVREIIPHKGAIVFKSGATEVGGEWRDSGYYSPATGEMSFEAFSTKAPAIRLIMHYQCRSIHNR